MQEKNILSLVITGDVTIDWNIAYASTEVNEPSEWTGTEDCRMSGKYGSAALLKEIITAMVAQLEDKPEVISYVTPENPDNPYDSQYFHCYAVWAPYDGDDKKNDSKKIWRVERFFGLDRSVKKESRDVPVKYSHGDPATADIIVIDDSDLGFRKHPMDWPQALNGFYEKDKSPWIIVKHSRPLAEGLLWEHLVSSFSSHLIVVLTIDDLRHSDIRVSAQISWERTALDLIWELNHNQSKINCLTEAAYIVISFGTAGALLIPGRNTLNKEPTLIFDPHYMEGELDTKNGMIIGKTSTLVASITRQIILKPTDPELINGIKLGIVAMRYLYRAGYEAGTDNLPVLLFPINQVITNSESELAKLAVAELPKFALDQRSQQASWTILKYRYPKGLKNLSERIIKYGTNIALKDIPLGRFGQLDTVDRQEIESLRSIQNLIEEYCNQREGRPVSIAVFGPPGSGKSFAVKQIAKVANPDKIADKILTFNLSQFNTHHELIDAFHQIRDISLSGKIPLVFWDEFDTMLDGKKLGWLRFFLAPMQDGEFQQGQLIHPIGKAIFVFAGGTSSSIDSFMNHGNEEETETISMKKNIKKGKIEKEKIEKEKIEKEKIEKELADAKVPDFLSRLKGFLNVLGPDPQKFDRKKGPYFIVRRAILLRSFFEQMTPNLLDNDKKLQIDSGIINAFLEIEKYKHGARSIEKIIGMSRLGKAIRFNRSLLPPEDQIKLHIDPVEFFKLVHDREDITNKLIKLDVDPVEFFKLVHDQDEITNKLARLIYNRYSKLLRDVPDKVSEEKTLYPLPEYDKLSKTEQDRYCEEAREIEKKIDTFG